MNDRSPSPAMPDRLTDQALEQAIMDNDPAACAALLEQGANPHQVIWHGNDDDGARQIGLFTLALQRCRPGHNADKASYIGIPLMLLRCGAARLVGASEHFLYFRDVADYKHYAHTNYPYGRVPESMMYEGNDWAAERYVALHAYVTQCQIRCNQLIQSSVPASQIQPQHLIDAYVVGRLGALLRGIDWQGHEAQLLILHDLMPPHIAEEMRIEAAALLQDALLQMADTPDGRAVWADAASRQPLQPTDAKAAPSAPRSGNKR